MSAIEVAEQSNDLAELGAAASACTNCPLHADATQVVFGSGSVSAWLMLVGEQPGDREDLAGEPFVGPAGKLLDRALQEAGINRADTYVTNAVKHFKFIRQGKRRIHQRPNVAEVRACRPWLDAELRVVRPAVVGTLGATAAQALLGSAFRITRQRGNVLEWNGLSLVATVHPSAILRGPPEERDVAFKAFVEDLRVIAAAAPAGPNPAGPNPAGPSPGG